MLRLIVLGYTNGEIASQLSVSLRKVETHRARLMQKLGRRTAGGTGRLRHRGWPRPSPLTRYLPLTRRRAPVRRGPGGEPRRAHYR